MRKYIRLPKKRWARALFVIVLIFLLALLGPYVLSRVMSPARALQVVEIGLEEQPRRPQSAGDARPTVRVACYNIAHGRGLARKNDGGGKAEERLARLDDIVQLLRHIDADIVVLNECDFDTSWSHSVDQAAYLAERAGYPHVATLRNIDLRAGPWTWRFGNAVLSRYPISEAREIEQPGYAKWETVLAGKKRSLFCEIEVGVHTIGVVAVHLSHRSEDLRAVSAQRLLDFTSGYGHPVILAGDFNSTPSGFPDSRTGAGGQNAMDLIDDAGLFQRLPIDPPTDPEEYTFRADDPRRVIDWILVPGSLTISDYSVEASDLSDHRPVVADVVLGE